MCVLLQSAMERNLSQLQRFADASGVLLAPHRKTSMSPQLFERQLAHGCWGLTVATCHQLRVARHHGISRVLHANQLVGRAEAWRVTGVSDQHAHVDAPAGHGIAVGDLIALGPSHPCTTFDKWRVLLHLVDKSYTVVDTVRTWF